MRQIAPLLVSSLILTSSVTFDSMATSLNSQCLLRARARRDGGCVDFRSQDARLPEAVYPSEGRAPGAESRVNAPVQWHNSSDGSGSTKIDMGYLENENLKNINQKL